MADWTRGMARTYEFWRVNPDTWGDSERLLTVTGATIVRDSDLDTLGSASFEMDSFEGEMYVRTYMVVEQDGIRERICLGTHLAIADNEDFDGMRSSTNVDAYTPLKELKDDKPPLGYTIKEGAGAAVAANIIKLHARCPVGSSDAPGAILEPYTAEPDSDTWLSFIQGFLAKADLKLDVDSWGNALIGPKQDMRSLAPVFTFDDGNSSILQPAVKISSNMPEVPNVVEVVYSTDSKQLQCELTNDDPGSMTSTVSRGRVVRYRESNPELPDSPTQADVDEFARRLMRDKGAATYEMSFSHGFIPDVTPGAAVRLDYRAMGRNVVAVVAQQTIRCTPGCQIETIARYTA